jgi:large subunit ribosomal protein L13
MKTRSIKKSEIKENWYIIDATDVRLGKLAVKAASILIGKKDTMKVSYLNAQNKVIVINSEKIDIFPKKIATKTYFRHSGFPGGAKVRSYPEMQAKFPERVIELAIKNMLPQTKMGRALFKNLKVVKGPTHPYTAQQPLEVKVK